MNALWAIPAVPALFVLYDQTYKRVRQWRMDNIAEKHAAIRAIKHLTPTELGQLGALLHIKEGEIVSQNLDEHTVSSASGLLSRDEMAFRLSRMERMMYAMASGNGISQSDLGALVDDVAQPLPELTSMTLSGLIDKHAHVPSLQNILIGETVDENAVRPLTLSIPDSVHVIVTGASGLGKSTLLEAMALQLLPLPNVKVAAIDYGSGTFDAVSEHLGWQLADDADLAISLMVEMIKEIKRRKELYGQFSRVRKLEHYNMLAQRHSAEPLPFIVLMIDETPPLLEHPGTKGHIIELARTGRKHGIGLIFGGTDFKADTMPSEARGNCQARMAFWLEAGLSRSLFNTTDANKLSGKGDILVKQSGSTGLVQGKTPLVINADYTLLDNGTATMQKSLQPIPDPNAPVSVTDDQIWNALVALAGSDTRFSYAQVERKMFGYTGGRAHKEVRRVVDTHADELAALLEGNE